MQALGTLYRNRWARYGASVLLLALILWRIQPGKVGNALASANPAYLALAALLTIPFLLLKATRWYWMLREAGIEAEPGEALSSLVAGMGLALLTPARLGELVRAAYIRDGQKLKIGGLVMLDKGFDVLVLCGLSIAGAWSLLGTGPGALLAAVTAVGAAMVYLPRRGENVVARVGNRLPGRDKLMRVLTALEALSPAATTGYILLTAMSFVIVLVQFALILASWNASSPNIVFLTFPLVVLTNVLPLTVGGLGIREGAAVLLLHHYGVSAAHAALAAFLMFFINTALPGLAGALIPTPRAAVTAPSLDAR